MIRVVRRRLFLALLLVIVLTGCTQLAERRPLDITHIEYVGVIEDMFPAKGTFTVDSEVYITTSLEGMFRFHGLQNYVVPMDSAWVTTFSDGRSYLSIKGTEYKFLITHPP